MPRISEFFGIVIAMYYNDHAPPHFHARSGGDEATYRSDSLERLSGFLPPRAHGLVAEWAALHQRSLNRTGRRRGQVAARADSRAAVKEVAVVRVVKVQALEGYRLRVAFTDGTERVIDVERFLRGPVFEPLKSDRALFEAVRVDTDLGTVIWPNGADIDPDVLYGTHEPAWMEDSAERQ